MSGYADTKKLIEDTLVGRPAGSLIYPEGHQAIDMSLLDYIHSVELLGASELQGIATTSTVPVQPDNAKVSYIATVPAGQTYVFTNFHDQNGNSISITTGANTVSLLTFLWNGEYWQVQNSQIQLMLNITAGYLYAGIAIPSTNPGSPDEPVFYIAAQAGTYANFGGIVVNEGEAAILKYVNSSWVKEVSGLATREELSRLGREVTDIEDDIEVKDPMIFDYVSTGYSDITPLSELANAIVRKSTGAIETASGKGLLYFPVVAGKKYQVLLNNLYCEGSYGIVSFSASVPAVNGLVTVIKAFDSSGSYTETVNYTAIANGYVAVQYGAAAQKGRISAKVETVQPVPKFVGKEDIDAELSLASENPVQNKVITERIGEIVDDIYENVTIENAVSLSQFHGYLVRKSNNTIETGNQNTGILYFPVLAGRKYKVSLADLYCTAAYSIVSFSLNAPALNGTTTWIYSPSSNESVTTSVEYTPASNGYILVQYNAATQMGRISAVEEVTETKEKYAPKRKWSTNKLTAIGDSLTEVNIRAAKNYLGFLHDWTGIGVQNLGVSGSGYAKGTNKFGDRISSIAADTDVIIVFGSFNDLDSSLPLGEITDTGTASVCGYINSTIAAIQAVFPLVNLGIITPTPWTGLYPGVTNAENYVDALKAICQKRSIPCLDLFHCSNLRPWEASFRAVAYKRDGTYTASTEGTPNAIQVTADLLSYVRLYGGLPNAQIGDWVIKDGAGVHPDEDGHKLIAPRFKAFIEGLLN